MAVLAVQEQGVTIDVHNDLLRVLKSGRPIVSRHVDEVTLVEVFGSVELTARARKTLLSKGIDTVFMTLGGKYLGRLLAAESSNASRRAAQYRFLGEPERVLSVARCVVETKLRNQRALLLRVRRSHMEHAAPAALAGLRHLIERVADVDDLNVLRGIEGQGAKLYFEGFGAAILNPVFSFKGRNRRPPKDPVNACLSFGYTLLLTRVESAVRRAGLDPYLGALHDPGRGKPSLCLDLMEVFRPAVVDRLVLRLLNRRQLTPDDFIDPNAHVGEVSAPPDVELDESEKVPNAVFLGPVGRPVMLREMARVWREPQRYEPDGKQLTLGAIVSREASQLARLFEGTCDRFVPYSLR